MPVTQARQFRLGDETIAMINALAAKWGGTVKPLSHTETIREMARRLYKSEIQPDPKPLKKKS